MINNSEANLISFKILLTRKNEIVTELSMLPEDEVDNIFPIDQRALIKLVLKNGKLKLKDIHAYLQRELNILT